MSKVDEIQKNYAVGYPRLEKLYKLSDKELKEFLKPFVPTKYEHMVSATASVNRIICDGLIGGIELNYYDTIVINWLSIDLELEHGRNKTMLLDMCNENIDIIIPETVIYMEDITKLAINISDSIEAILVEKYPDIINEDFIGCLENECYTKICDVLEKDLGATDYRSFN